MRRFLTPTVLIAALLAGMVALMLEPLREEGATMDEALNLGTGYFYAAGYGHYFNPEHPPLGQMLPGLPLLFMNVEVPAQAELLAKKQIGLPRARRWVGWEGDVAEKLYPGGRHCWYYWPYGEAGLAGHEFVYGGTNDADEILWAGRMVQVGLTVLTGIVIACWLWRMIGAGAALLGVFLWVFNPIALGHGHLVVTDISVTLGMTLAVWAFTEYLGRPTWRAAALAGAAMGVALVMKFSAVTLAPMFVALVGLWWQGRWRGSDGRDARMFWKCLPVMAVTAWLVVMAAYAPDWTPAPALSSAQAERIGVPGWFQALRPVLVPAGFFKGVALQAAHAACGHTGFLCGEWRMNGWWYYFPLALFWKQPVALLVLTLGGLGLWLGRLRRVSVEESAPWVAGLVFLGLAMTSTINIGVRYVLPVLPLFAVAAAAQWTRARCCGRVVVYVLCGWLAVATVQAHPFYIEYFNRFGGGTQNGYRCLVDSNYDWGQDAKRLRDYIDRHPSERFCVRFFGVQQELAYYGIKARQAGTNATRLVVSASSLMKNEWTGWRESQKPVDRIGQTLFVYDLRGVTNAIPARP